jgi:hypothetical protein
MADEPTDAALVVTESAPLSPAAEKIRVALEQARWDREHRDRPMNRAIERNFLDLFASGVPEFQICQLLGISRGTIYQRRRRDPEFGQRWDEARESRYTPIEDRLAEIAETGDMGSMATVRAAEVLLKGSIARYNSAPRQQASATIRQTAEGGQLSISVGTPLP